MALLTATASTMGVQGMAFTLTRFRASMLTFRNAALPLARSAAVSGVMLL